MGLPRVGRWEVGPAPGGEDGRKGCPRGGAVGNGPVATFLAPEASTGVIAPAARRIQPLGCGVFDWHVKTFSLENP